MNDIAIDLNQVEYGISNRKILKNISFKVRTNTVHGFLGPNGAGKTTTLGLIAGLSVPDRGNIAVLGEKMRPENYSLKNKIGYLPENPPLYEDMRVKDYLLFLAQLRGIKGSKSQQAVQNVMEMLSLEQQKDRLLGNLSRGNRQRAGFAQALIHQPEIVILDEPTLGLDPQAIVLMRQLIRELTAQHTIILSSHQLQEVEKLCDDVTIIKEGSILLSGQLENIFKRRDFSTQKIFIKTYGIDTALLVRLKSLPYISYIHSMGEAPSELSTLEVEIKKDEDYRGKLVSDIIHYGGTPVEIISESLLEKYLLKEESSWQ